MGFPIRYPRTWRWSVSLEQTYVRILLAHFYQGMLWEEELRWLSVPWVDKSNKLLILCADGEAKKGWPQIPLTHLSWHPQNVMFQATNFMIDLVMDIYIYYIILYICYLLHIHPSWYSKTWASTCHCDRYLCFTKLTLIMAFWSRICFLY